MSCYLDPSIIENMRNAVCESIYLHKNIAKFNMICAVMDRVDSAIRYLNEHSGYPADESQYLTFMAYACMIQDALVNMSNQIDGFNPMYSENENEFFGKVFDMSPLKRVSTECPDDQKFFRYIRSISFAHTFNTDKSKFLPKGIQHYSPMVTFNRYEKPLAGYDECICVLVYPNNTDYFCLHVPWKCLLGYIQAQYEMFTQFTTWVQVELENQIAEWKIRKIDRSGTVPEILQRVIDLIHDRYEPLPKTFEDDWENSKACMLFELLRDYTLELTDSSNVASVERYRKAIADAMPELCEIMDNIGDWDEVTYRFLFAHPKTMHPEGGYELEKIHSMRAEDYRSTYHGRQLAADFAKGFASKWVHIDAQSMPVEEIQLLANVACYLEAQTVGEWEW